VKIYLHRLVSRFIILQRCDRDQNSLFYYFNTDMDLGIKK